jgi:flagellar biogenesis protein FliO
MLQPKKSIYVVRVLGKILVVGASENGLNSLASFDYNELEEAADTVPDTSGTITPTFFNFLKENIGIIRMKSISRSKKIL